MRKIAINIWVYLSSIIIIVASAIGNIYKIPFLRDDIHATIIDLAVLAIIVSGLVIGVVTQNRDSKYSKTVLAFLAVAILTLLVSGSRYGPAALLVGSLYILRWAAYGFFPFFSRILQNSPKGRHLPLIVCLVIIIVSVAQYLWQPDIRHLAVAEWDPHYYRVVGSFLDPGFTGLLLVFSLVFFTIKPRIHSQIVRTLLWGINYLAFAFTYSRSSYLGYLAAMAYISWRRRSIKFFLATTLLLAITIPILPRASDGDGVKLERKFSVSARFDSWKNSLIIFFQNPILGVGFNTYRYAQRAYKIEPDSKWLKSHAGAGADSSLLFVAATTGMVGLTAYLYYLRHLFSYSGLRYYLIPLLFHSFFLNSLFYPYVMFWLALMLGEELKHQPA
ncbi:hypothetical protein A2634_04000 [Candidatus Amesbacteria bacterium RIFCSPHIGHO2_01_FULL_48_32]|uniref:O-antigen ligase-related domain-containing protein n=1 Tax=Candidatus Amesbacteria bacterium RIFCSPLOWO2_01_FULL_48_25 TaxID=1797259 RepID=A0A1F4ZC22_9BACT|nr:MAG: hypothetical protein A2634_04000 [Candidatus Amesbacteria bacterium RIFCSPHIGHO2_01_FULL_48_32]OGD03929.1 MAG: hypothetical protein A2989_04505 [Candidatus Amesbacteria bacterium RIFCSPLOWO2_01_FULL_48_25]HJZ05342.1 O-antigen ligase family protein [Patescibacteria group bacterium]